MQKYRELIISRNKKHYGNTNLRRSLVCELWGNPDKYKTVWPRLGKNGEKILDEKRNLELIKIRQKSSLYHFLSTLMMSFNPKMKVDMKTEPTTVATYSPKWNENLLSITAGRPIRACAGMDLWDWQTWHRGHEKTPCAHLEFDKCPWISNSLNVLKMSVLLYDSTKPFCEKHCYTSYKWTSIS